MTDSNFTHIAFLLDRTGSMDAIRSDAIGGFNTFVDDQKKAPAPGSGAPGSGAPGKCSFTLVQFDSENPQEVIHDMAPIDHVPQLTEKTYVPRAATPLLDAMGHLIVNTGQRLANLPEHERPSRVIFVTLTDGQENASQEYDRRKIFEMIKHQREQYNWQFVFLAANQDAIATAEDIGIQQGKAMTFAASPTGSREAFRLSGQMVSRMRSRPDFENMDEDSFTPAERSDMQKELDKVNRKFRGRKKS
ncbi:MAG: VWA domain-containing protein [Phycisphaera sp.]|nr:VWA domain-containing protein [Phycisphaera sp.]